MPIIQDDRTATERQSHRLAIVGTDSFMSGWGEASNGASYAAWAFKDGEYAACQRWVNSRSDMTRIRVVRLDGYRPNAAHTHIYTYKPHLHDNRYI